MGVLNSMAKASAEARASSTPGMSLRDPALNELMGVGAGTSAGVSVTPESARECPEVDACVGLIEDTIATVPLDLYEKVGPDRNERRSDHPLHELLHDQPNSWQTSAEFRQMMEGWRSTEGMACARIVWRRDRPAALEPLQPGTCVPFRFNGGRAYRWQPPDGEPRTLLQHEVLQVNDKPFSRDGLRGRSRVLRHRESIGMALATGQYLSRFFANNAVPKAFIRLPGDISPESEELLRKQYETRHAGLENAHRIGVLKAGIDIKALAVNNDEAQVIDSYNLAVARIARAWGVPLHLIGETSKSTSWGTGIEQQSIGFISYYMRPKFVAWEQALNMALMSSDMRKRFTFEFNMDGLLRGDFKTRMEGFALMIQWGLATPNEIRRLMNLAPDPDGGDERLQPLNMAPASRIMDVLLRTAPAGGGARDADQLLRTLATMLRPFAEAA